MSLRQRIGLELFRAYRHNNARLHPLCSLFWECTLRCNMSCLHCGSDCKMAANTPDMPADDFLRAVDRLRPHVNPNTTFIIFTGGEALLRPDIESVGLQLYRWGFPWGVVTNGLLLTPQRLESLRQTGLHSVSVSLDGMAEDHDWIRCRQGSFQAATDALKALTQAPDILWDVVTCVNPRNCLQLPQLRDYLVSIGVSRWRIFSIFPMGRAAHNPQLQLSDSQFRHILDFIRMQRSIPHNPIRISYACEGFLGNYEQKVRDQFFYCRSGIEVMSVLCNGDISGCTSIRSNLAQGNIYRDDIWEVWQHRFQAMRNRSWTRKGQCNDCKVWRYCEGSGLHLYDDDGHLLTCHYHRLG